jgi:hypothetical protein
MTLKKVLAAGCKKPTLLGCEKQQFFSLNNMSITVQQWEDYICSVG